MRFRKFFTPTDAASVYNTPMRKIRIAAALCSAALLLFAPVPVMAGEDVSAVCEELTSDYAYVMDPDTGQVLLDKGSTDRIYPASMTKIMTAIAVLDTSPDLDATVTITDDMLAGLYEANASVVGYQAGDTPTIRDLLYGTVLPSGADAVNALAVYTSGTVESFVALMNEKAAGLGMNDTHFVNPTGLHDDDHYSTCRDIAVLLEYALQNETFAAIFETERWTDSLGNVLEATILPYTTSYSIDLPGFEGDKTGYTLEGGHCMASLSELNGMRIITITAHAMTGMYDPSHLYDASTILTWLRDNYSRRTVLTAGEDLKTYTAAEIVGSRSVTVSASEDLSLDVKNDAAIEIETDIPDTADVTNKKQEKTAVVSILADGEEIFSFEESYTVPASDDVFNMFLIFLRDLF